MMQDRRSFMRAVSASGIGIATTGLFSDRVAASTVVTVRGAGYNIWGDRDAFHYYYQPLSGNFDVTVRSLSVEETSGAAFGGVMV